MVDHILEIPGLAVFGVKCFNCDTKKLCLRNNPAWIFVHSAYILIKPCNDKISFLELVLKEN